MSRDFIRSTGREFTRSVARDRNFSAVTINQSLRLNFYKLGAWEYYPRYPLQSFPSDLNISKRRFQRIRIKATHGSLMSGGVLSNCEETIQFENTFSSLPRSGVNGDLELATITVNKSSNWPGPVAGPYSIVESQVTYTRLERVISGFPNPFKIEVWLEDPTDTDHELIRQMLTDEPFGTPNTSLPSYSPGAYWEERITYTIPESFGGKAQDNLWQAANVPFSYIGQGFLSSRIPLDALQSQRYFALPSIGYFSQKLLVSDSSGKRWEFVALGVGGETPPLTNSEEELSCGLASIPSGVILPPASELVTKGGKLYVAAVFPPHTLDQVFGTTPTCVP